MEGGNEKLRGPDTGDLRVVAQIATLVVCVGEKCEREVLGVVCGCPDETCTKLEPSAVPNSSGAQRHPSTPT